MNIGIARQQALNCTAGNGVVLICKFALTLERFEITMGTRRNDAFENLVEYIYCKTSASVTTGAANITTLVELTAALLMCAAPEIFQTNVDSLISSGIHDLNESTELPCWMPACRALSP
jgi:hypothetical protein